MGQAGDTIPASPPPRGGSAGAAPGADPSGRQSGVRLRVRHCRPGGERRRRARRGRSRGAGRHGGHGAAREPGAAAARSAARPGGGWASPGGRKQRRSEQIRRARRRPTIRTFTKITGGRGEEPPEPRRRSAAAAGAAGSSSPAAGTGAAGAGTAAGEGSEADGRARARVPLPPPAARPALTTVTGDTISAAGRVLPSRAEPCRAAGPVAPRPPAGLFFCTAVTSAEGGPGPCPREAERGGRASLRCAPHARPRLRAAPLSPGAVPPPFRARPPAVFALAAPLRSSAPPAGRRAQLLGVTPGLPSVCVYARINSEGFGKPLHV